MPRFILIYLTVIVSLGWIANLTFTLVIGGGDPTVNGVFALILGGIFANERAARKLPAIQTSPIPGEDTA